jgi:2-polyprenyl-3-methyl-5-hydroxy-6-metoxy-1,4-benzoquinol methylase
VLEIACNDGSQLDKYKNKGWKTVGVDPAENIYEISSKKGHKIYCGFWDNEISNDIRIKYKNVDLIIAENVFAHLDNVYEFLLNCKKIMNDDSLLFIQTSQSNMTLNNEYDTVYHEHLSFFSVNSMNVLVKRVGLYLNNVTKTNIHGTSFVFEISKINNPKNIKEMLDQEYKYIDDKNFYINYKEQCLNKTYKLVETLKTYKKNNFKIVSYGASAKGNTILNFIKGEYVDYIVDDNPLKCNLYTPGTNILIKSTNSLLEEKNKLAILMLTWNFEKEIKQKITDMNLNIEIEYIQYEKMV